jgi:hypothetical protein
MGTEVFSNIADRFVIAKCRVKEIFVDETLLKKINGQDYWLWITYDEPNLHMPVCYSIYHLEKELFFMCVTSFSGKLEVDMEARLSIRMVHIGTRLLVNGG